MTRPKRVSVGSRNRAKLSAVEAGLRPFFPDVVIEAVDVESGVDEQPVGFDEIIAGARNRALRSYAAMPCDLAAGIEDGLVEIAAAPAGYMNVGACVLFDGRNLGVGLTAGFEYPPDCVRAAVGPPRTPIGDVFDARFDAAAASAQAAYPSHEQADAGAGSNRRRDPGQAQRRDPGGGNVGRLTGGVLSRSRYGEQAVVCALVRLLHPDLYSAEGASQ